MTTICDVVTIDIEVTIFNIVIIYKMVPTCETTPSYDMAYYIENTMYYMIPTFDVITNYDV